MLSPEAIEKELPHKILKMIFAESDEGVSVGEIKSILQYTQEMIEGYRLELPSLLGTSIKIIENKQGKFKGEMKMVIFTGIGGERGGETKDINKNRWHKSQNLCKW